MREIKSYLGDGVYADLRNETGSIVLTTEDGIGAMKIIYLEPEVYAALVAFVARAKEKLKGETDGLSNL